MIESLNSLTKSVLTLFSLMKENAIQSCYKIHVNFLDCIGMRGFLTILGIRTTTGSVDVLPVKRNKLIKSFNKMYKESSKISVGARALSKHSDRNRKTENFWGVCKGSEEARNLQAHSLCLEILTEAAWIGCFNHSANTCFIEIRNREGYGLRWDLKSLEFKGLVEPQNDDKKERKAKE